MRGNRGRLYAENTPQPVTSCGARRTKPWPVRGKRSTVATMSGEMGTSVLFSGGTMLSLNLLGTEIWKLCDGRSADEIVAELLPQFEVEEDMLRGDVQAFLDELAEKGFITYEK